MNDADTQLPVHDFGRVAVTMGGIAAERDISLKSGQAVLSALLEQGIDAFGVDIDSNPIETLQQCEFDRVFNIVHGRGGEDGILQAVLEAMNKPYTGTGVLGSALTMDKYKTKLCWLANQLPTPDCVVMKTADDIRKVTAQLGYPVIVKPVREGSSLGMSKVDSEQQLQEAWRLALKYDDQVMAEQWITGEEYTVAILDNQALPMIRLETPNLFYDYQAKYFSDSTRYHCPCGLAEQEEEKLQTLALQASVLVDVSGWCRVDLLIDEQANPWLIEVNTVPGMTDHSLVPMAARQAGIGFNTLVRRILQTSVHSEQQSEVIQSW